MEAFCDPAEAVTTDFDWRLRVEFPEVGAIFTELYVD